MRRAVLVIAVAALACGCGGQGDPAASPTRTSAVPSPSVSISAAPSPAPEAATRAPERTPSPTPAIPALTAPTDTAAFAHTLDQAAATLRDPRSPETDVRRAALVQQLAASRLAEGPASVMRAVARRLDRQSGDQLESDVGAARELGALTAGQPHLPQWRIVTPPPPETLLRYYRQAARATGVPWQYLAAINLVETRMGRIRGTSTAGAQGPMQFLPSTFEQYAAPGGDIEDPADSIMAAARLLRAHGAPGDIDAAIYAYNHSDHYVRAVTAYATQMAASPAAYRSYWHWQVFYHRTDRTFLLPEGYPRKPPVPLPGS